MFDKLAVVGDKDLIYALRVLGIKIYTPQNVSEAKSVLEKLEEDNIALCFLHQSFLEPLKEERENFKKKFTPVVVGYSDYRKVTDHLEKMMKKMSVKATGSDSLMKRRGNHGTR